MNERMLLEDGLKQLSLSFSPQSVEKLLRFSDFLLEKNRVMNLTAATDPTEVVTRHFLDCAVLAPYLPAGQTVLDVGTGAGFPGVPLAILCPDTVFTLLDVRSASVSISCRRQSRRSACPTAPLSTRGRRSSPKHIAPRSMLRCRVRLPSCVCCAS